MYTVKQVAVLAGVSVRTLHYYDEIGLLSPSHVAANGYRRYDEAALLRLQQILFYREIGLPLEQIKALLDSPTFDLAAALQQHRAALQGKIAHLQSLIHTVDSTLSHLSGEQPMPPKRLFEAFTPEKEQEYTRLARLQYDPTIVGESVKRWNNYNAAQKEAVRAEGNQIYAALTEALSRGQDPHSDTVQAILVRWHNHIRYFYEPTLEILRGLAETYLEDPAFRTNFEALHPDLPAFLHQAIDRYVDELETAELRRLLAEDDSAAAHQDV